MDISQVVVMDNQGITPILFDPDSSTLKKIAALLLEQRIPVVQIGRVSELINSIGFNNNEWYLTGNHQIVIIGLGQRTGQTMRLIDFITRFKSDIQLFLYYTGQSKKTGTIFLPVSMSRMENVEVHVDDVQNIAGLIERFIRNNGFHDVSAGGSTAIG